jgi:fructose-1,6-bisphosphatase/inositol monophosphatase family enzyme
MTKSPVSIDIDAVSALIVAVGQSEVLPYFQKLGADAIHIKSQPGDLVTDADLASERALTPALRDLLPGSLVVGEEATYADPRLLDLIAGEEPVWIIDPIDGTFNFASGVPCFGMIVALTVAGETVAGWIHDPVTGAMITAEHGAGAWKSGQRLSVGAGGRPLSSLSLSAPGNPVRPWKTIVSREIYRRSAAQEYIALVSGSLDLALFTKMMPWDHAAGVLIHREAGGKDLVSDGRPYAPTIHQGSFVLGYLSVTPLFGVRIFESTFGVQAHQHVRRWLTE